MQKIIQELTKIAKILRQPIFDVDGLGGVPMQKSIDYYGFIKNMRISQFKKLVPSGRSSEGKRFQQLKDKIYNGTAIAPPFLEVQWNNDLGCWQCYGHEGRSRLDAIKQLYSDIIIPVHIFPYKLRSRDLTDQMKKAIILKQD